MGLDHQDEDFNNTSLFSCMDYQNPPYQFPNTHDYQQLDTIYGHLDAYNSYTGGEQRWLAALAVRLLGKAATRRTCLRALPATRGASPWDAVARRRSSSGWIRMGPATSRS